MTPKVQWLLGFLLSQTHKMTCAVTAQAYGGFPFIGVFTFHTQLRAWVFLVQGFDLFCLIICSLCMFSVYEIWFCVEKWFIYVKKTHENGAFV
jgi:hypothetical protein